MLNFEGETVLFAIYAYNDYGRMLFGVNTNRGRFKLRSHSKSGMIFDIIDSNILDNYLSLLPRGIDHLVCHPLLQLAGFILIRAQTWPQH